MSIEDKYEEKFISSEFPINGNIWIDGMEWWWVSSTMTPDSDPLYTNKFMVVTKPRGEEDV